jgi:hypothetical protein
LRPLQPEQLRQSDRQLREAEIDARSPRDDDDVEGTLELSAVVAKPFPDPPLESIPLHRGTRFSPDGDPESAPRKLGAPGLRTVQAISPTLGRHDDELRRRTPAAPAKNPGEVSRIEKPVAGLEPPGLDSDGGFGLPFGCRPPRPVQSARHAYFEEMLTAIRFRPLARRAFKTARPPLVFIRSRNPWVRRRLIRLGWNVRFMTADPHSFIEQAEGSGDLRTTALAWPLASGFTGGSTRDIATAP